MSDPRVIPIKRSRFELLAFDDIELSTESEYLITKLIPRNGVGVVWGPPKCGKSFWLSDALLHVALGWEYRGRRVKQGPVVYCAFEGAFGFRKRIEAFRSRMLSERDGDVPFYLLPIRVDVIADHTELIGSIRLQLEEAGQPSPVAVAFDTLNRSLRGSESNDEDMGAYVAAADAVREAFDCAVLIVHHCGVEGTRPRGHTSLTGAADAQLAVRREGENVVVEVEWLKDGPEGDKIVSRLKSIEIGTDDNGEPITSCIVEAAEGVTDTGTTPKPKSWPKAARTALRALQEAVNEAGEAAPAALAAHIPLGTRVATLDSWRSYAYRRGISATDAGERAKQQAFKRASEWLIGAGEAHVWDEFVWTTA